ncbi:protein transport protein Sec16A isoform X1 [Silurus meridionalis]|nr:protein transport protein Sec16A isoform X1 [Silurus meridionalis]
MSELEKNCSEVTDTQHKEEADGQNVPFPGPLMRIPTNHIISQEVLKRTEVYEYVLSLTSGFGQPHFQKIKLIHAQNLVAVGLKALALDYCESIATTIFRSPRLFNRYILAQLIVFCEKLLEGKEDVDWMMKLRRLFRFFSTPISVVCPDQVALEKIPYQPEEFEGTYSVM